MWPHQIHGNQKRAQSQLPLDKRPVFVWCSQLEHRLRYSDCTESMQYIAYTVFQDIFGFFPLFLCVRNTQIWTLIKLQFKCSNMDFYTNFNQSHGFYLDLWLTSPTLTSTWWTQTLNCKCTSTAFVLPPFTVRKEQYLPNFVTWGGSIRRGSHAGRAAALTWVLK